MSRCVIVTAYLPEGVAAVYAPKPGDFLLCADGGYALARAAGLAPDMVIGDFDSMALDGVDCPNCIRVPAQKDDTDTLLCVKQAISLGYTDILLLGGLGGRLDHTLANLQTLSYAHTHGAAARICDAQNEAFLLAPGSHAIAAREGYKLSVFAWGGDCSGVGEQGVHYPLSNATITGDFPIGVSNVFTAPFAGVSLDAGTLLCVLSRY